MRTKERSTRATPPERELPPECAFVLRLERPASASTAFAGRIEHVASGEATRFRSLAGVREFVRRVLDGCHGPSAPGRATGGYDGSTTT